MSCAISTEWAGLPRGGPLVAASTTASATTQTVGQAGSTTTVTSSATPGVFGQAITFTATISPVNPGAGTPTGLVTFTVDNVDQTPVALDGSGKATLTLTALDVTTASSHTITAKYKGDTNFTASDSTATPLNQQVDKADTTTALSLVPTPSVFGQGVTVTAAVSAVAPGAGQPTGKITFIVDNQPQTAVNLNAGSATLTLPSLSAGPHTVSASYSGDANFNTSGSGAALTQQVNADATTLTLTSSHDPSVFGESVTITAAIGAVAPGAGTPSGDVTIVLDQGQAGTQSQTLTLNNGQAQATFSGLPVGTHSFTASFTPGDTNFQKSASQTPLVQQVGQASTTTTLTSSAAGGSVFGQSVTFTATVAAAKPGTGTPTGQVTFTVDGNPQPAVALDKNGVATLPLSNLAVGSHQISASYAGDGTDYQGSTVSSALTQQVGTSATTTTLISSTPSASFGGGVTFTATVAPTGNGAGTPTGTVTFTIDGATPQMITQTATLSGGQATLALNTLSAGNHQVSASYAGDGSFAGSATTFTLTQQVTQALTTTKLVSSAAGSAVFGQPVTITATVSENGGTLIPTGKVSFTVDSGTPITVALDRNGQATLPLSGLSTSSHTIVASYGGDSNNQASPTQTLTQVVNPDSTSIGLATSLTPSVSGQGVTLSASVSAASPGAGTPTGSVSFYDGSIATANLLGTQTLAGGQASITLSSLAVGAHQILASYTGDTNFSATSTPAGAALAQQVNQAASSVSLTSSVAPAVFGQSITFTATASAASPGSGTPSGTVTFTIDGKAQTPVSVDGSGKATLVLSNLSLGSHNITAGYDGDTNFKASASAATLVQTITQAATGITLASATTPSVYGQPVTFTATVAPTGAGAGIPTGTLSFIIGAVTETPIKLDATGKATFTAPPGALAVGTNAITASYSGDGNFRPSTIFSAQALTQVVNPASTSTTLAVSANPSVYGQVVTITASVGANAPGTGTPTGTVTFTLDGQKQKPITLSGGQAVLSLSGLTVTSGTPHSIVAVYSGDNNFASSSANLSQTVNPAQTTVTLSSSASSGSVAGQSVTFTAAVAAAAPGAGIPTGTVTFSIDGVAQPAATISNGQAIWTTSALAVGTRSITAAYSGDTNDAQSSATALSQVVTKDGTSLGLASSANPASFGSAATITATVAAQAPGSGTPTGSVTFTVDSTSTTVNLANGQAVLNLDPKLAQGSHTITASYSGDSSFTTSTTSSPLQQQVSAAASTLALTASAPQASFGQGVVFTATVSAAASGLGTPTGSVTFTVDGTQMPATSLAVATPGTATATLTLSNLGIGNHSVSATYAGDNTFNGSNSAAPVNVNVVQDGTTIQLSAPSPSVFGQPVTVTAMVAAALPGAGTPTGQVTFMLDGKTEAAVLLGNTGQASFTLPVLSLGNHSISATYAGDTNFQMVSTNQALAEQVNQAATTITLTPGNAGTVFGTALTITAVVAPTAPATGTPSGTVTVVVDQGLASQQSQTATLSGGQALVTFTGLAVGAHQFTASYSGDADFQGGATAAAVSQPISKATSTTTLNSSLALSVVGQAVTFTATVSAATAGGAAPTGQVVFTVDGAQQTVGLDPTGRATLTLSSLAPMTHHIDVQYSGDSNFQSSSATLTQQVNQASTATALSSSASAPVFGTAVTFTATVSAVAPGSGVPTGSVTFTIDGVIQAPVNVNAAGQASLTETTLSAGSHTILASYSGDTNFNPSTVAIGQQVSAAPTNVSLATTSVSGQDVTLQANVTSTPGAPSPAGTVTFLVDGSPVGSSSVTNGSATFTAQGLTSGTHSFSAVYTPIGTNASASSASAAQVVQILPNGGGGISPHGVAFALRARLTNLTHRGNIHGASVRITALTTTGLIAGGTFGHVSLKVLSGPHGGKVTTHKRIALSHGATLASLYANKPGVYKIRLSEGSLSTTISIRFK